MITVRRNAAMRTLSLDPRAVNCVAWDPPPRGLTMILYIYRNLDPAKRTRRKYEKSFFNIFHPG